MYKNVEKSKREANRLKSFLSKWREHFVEQRKNIEPTDLNYKKNVCFLIQDDYWNLAINETWKISIKFIITFKNDLLLAAIIVK